MIVGDVRIGEGEVGSELRLEVVDQVAWILRCCGFGLEQLEAVAGLGKQGILTVDFLETGPFQGPFALAAGQAVSGDTVEVRIPVLAVCEECDGNGAAPGTSPSTCPECQGAGQIRVSQGFFSLQQTCPRCRGQGRIVTDPCRSCGGAGRKEKRKTLSVKIPAGVDTGDRIRLTGEGEAGMHGGPPGDLYVQIEVREHSIFVREGRNLYCEVPISIPDAALGGELEVPTLDGRVKLKIPAETQTGKVFRLRGKGVTQVRGGGVGDLLCKVVVETPVKLTERQKELLSELKVSLGESAKHSPREKTWFDGVKSFFDGLKG